LTPDVQAAAERVRAFLAAFEDSAHPQGAISTLRSEGLRLTAADLRELLADRDNLAAAIERTTTKMRDYASQDVRSVNVRQVINLLSPTWPDGNYEAPEPTRHAPLTDEPCGHTTTPAGTAAVNAYRAHRTQQHPRTDLRGSETP